ncbi:hypothetical protein [Marinomonas sp.]|uniref:hypothetical protein n=1 Tax=Marinomonas sp. TaxID=1904862 RepID=UPI003BAC9A5C
MQVEVEQSRIMVLYTQGCYDNRVDCSARENADPNGYVIRSPADTIDVVALFDGHGESSPTPFPGSPYDKRSVWVGPAHLGSKITLTDTEGRTATNGSSIGDLTRIQGDWQNYIGKDDSGKSMYRFFHIDQPIDTEVVKNKIHIMRKGLAHKYFATFSYIEINDSGNVKIFYRMVCASKEECDHLEKSRDKALVERTSKYRFDILLFEGKAEELDTPFENKGDLKTN